MKCEICNAEFVPYRSHGKYCSNACRKIAKDRSRTFSIVEVKCHVCGKSVFIRLSDYNRSTRNGHVFYCSQECELVRRRKVVYCEHCGIELLRSPSTIRKHMYCSRECQEASGNYRPRQESHWHWKGGGRYYRGENWTVIRKEIRKRDNYTCQKCGITEEQTGVTMDVHHIKPYRLFDNEDDANDSANLITLCRSCHHREDALLRI